MVRAINGLSRDEIPARLAEQGWRRLPGDPDTSRYSAGTALDGPGRYTERAIGAVLRVRGLDDRVTDDDLDAFFSAVEDVDPKSEARVTIGLRRVLAARGIDTSQEVSDVNAEEQQADDRKCGACRYDLDQHDMGDPKCDYYEDPELKAESVKTFNAERFDTRTAKTATPQESEHEASTGEAEDRFARLRLEVIESLQRWLSDAAATEAFDEGLAPILRKATQDNRKVAR